MVCSHKYRTRRDGAAIRQDGDIELVIFDMDGVLIDIGSSWRMVHDHFGTDNTDALNAYLDGRIDDHEFIRHDVRLWKESHAAPVPSSLIDSILAVPPFMHGARAALDRLHERGIATAIVSGGIDHMANKVADGLGIEHVYANGLATDAQGHLNGEGILRTPLHDKGAPVRQLLDDLDTAAEQAAALGNSCPDVSMFEHVGLGIAFNPEDACVQHAADLVVPSRDLRDGIASIT